MQNIPYVEKETYTKLTTANMADRIPEKAKKDLFEDFFSQQISYASPSKGDTEEALYQDLFTQQEVFVQEGLATAPLSTDEKMIKAAPQAASATKVEEKEVLKPSRSMVEEQPAEKKMTREDLDEVRDDLKEYGLSDEEIQDMEDRIDSDEGLTWGQFVSELNEKISQFGKVELSPEQTEKLQSMFGKLGFSDKESGQLIKDLENGNSKKVLNAIMEKLDALPQGTKILFDKGEVEAFAAAMNSSKEFTVEIKKMFSKAALPKDMKEAFSLISQETAKLDQKEIRLVRAVGKALVKAMGKELKDSSAAADTNKAVDLKERTAKGEKAASKKTGNAKAENSEKTKAGSETDLKAEIADADQQDSEEKAPVRQVEAKQAEAARTVAKESDAGQAVAREGEFKEALKNLQENSTHKSDRNEKDALPQFKQAETNADAKQENAGQTASDKNAKQENAWNQFFGKLTKDESGSAKSSFGKLENLAQALKGSGSDSAKTALTDMAGNAKTRVWEKISAPKVMRQVNNAIFTNLGQGKKQLTLHLKPEALGAVKVVLQVQGKEVNATLRAESAEAAKVIADHVESIKQSLENQGLKVNKLDVQTGLAENDGRQNWQGEMQHNQARERDEMARMRQRMRNLREGTGILAQDMQNMTDTANVAEQGLHVVA
ncbi:flagellar hook-length control protein FliK [Salidesulfovibrio onnuriiensis]|uniref:flagellar hook-length control protein FliK n=1 Tax=Salidesulfovibrio onnuriiensis TaxID=2583823 RepID=UPI0011C79EE0|nr:flagellar hook-length control protein FliK [Salidesulfovibrio onnuriiensis]